MHRFEDDKYYFTASPALRILGTRGSLAQMRHKGKGPIYHKIGSKVVYLGSDLNAYLTERRVLPVNN